MSLVPLGSLATAAGPRAAETPPPAPLRIASFNTASWLGTNKAVSDITTVAAGVDILALQEMSSPERRARVRAALVDCETCVFDFFVPTGGAGPAGTPILYLRDRFRLLGSGSVQVTEATYVGDRGAGPSTVRPRYVNWVRLMDRHSRRQVYVFNNHAVASVQASDGGPNSLLRRQEIYRKHMAGLTRLITELRDDTGGTAFVTGDFNVNFRKDRIVATPYFPYAGLGRIAVHAGYERLGEPAVGTHVLPSGFDLRLIDYVSILDHRAVVPVEQEIILGLNSDHRPVVLSATLKYRLPRPS